MWALCHPLPSLKITPIMPRTIRRKSFITLMDKNLHLLADLRLNLTYSKKFFCFFFWKWYFEKEQNLEFRLRKVFLRVTFAQEEKFCHQKCGYCWEIDCECAFVRKVNILACRSDLVAFPYESGAGSWATLNHSLDRLRAASEPLCHPYYPRLRE